MVNLKLEEVAAQMGMRPQSVLQDFTVEGIEELAQSTARALKEHEAWRAPALTV